MKVALTGHRPDKLGKEYDLKGPYSEAIYKALLRKIDELKPTRIITGLALGSDTLWALAGIKRNILIDAAIPFEGQESHWPPRHKERYFKILTHPLVTKHYVCDPGYAKWKMQKRNMWMVDQLADPDDKLIAIWDGTDGGTKNCVDYFKEVKKGEENLIKINPHELLRQKV